MTRKKLSVWAAEHGVHYRTALSWVRDGKLPPESIERTPGGHIRVIINDTPDQHYPEKTVIYSRVSSADQRQDLERQIDRLRSFAGGLGLAEVEVIKEIGSGLNGKRSKLIRLLSDPKITTIIVEHRDRLSRFGVEYLESALSAQNRRLVVAEKSEKKLDLVQDFIDVVTSMCSRIYGKRSAKNRAKKAVAAAAE